VDRACAFSSGLLHHPLIALLDDMPLFCHCFPFDSVRTSFSSFLPRQVRRCTTVIQGSLGVAKRRVLERRALMTASEPCGSRGVRAGSRPPDKFFDRTKA
jgi:hypothetical protein